MSILPKVIIDLMQFLTKFQYCFHRNRKKNYPRICEEPQKTPNSQRNFDKEGQRRKPYISHFSYQSILQNYSSQNSTVVA